MWLITRLIKAIIADSFSHKMANTIIAVFILRLKMFVNHSAIHINI